MNSDSKIRTGPLGQIALGTAILFVAFPANMLAGNIQEIPGANRYFLTFVAIGLAVLALGWLVARVAGSRVAGVLAALFAGYAVSIYVSDILFPLGIGPMEDGEEVAPFLLLGSAVQIVLFVAMAGILLKASYRLSSRFSWIAAAVLVVSAGVQMAGAQFSRGEARAGEPAEAMQEQAFDGFNIYHLVFDTYYGPWLQFAMDELGMSEETFAGFTYYPAARSNYWYTRYSFPSFLSGSMYRPEISRKEWQAEADASSLVGDLKERGYQTTIYGLAGRHGFGPAHQFLKADTGPGFSFPLLLDYWALRTSPVALRPYALPGGQGPFSRAAGLVFQVPTGDTRSYDSHRQFRQMLADESERPDHGQYVLFHSYPPHGPNQLDRDGNYVGESSYEEQLLLATNMMEDFISRLRELGRYERSLVIFHSDHGSARAASHSLAGDPLRYFITVDDATSAAIREIDVRDITGRHIDARYSALLMIKAPVDCPDAGPAMTVDRRLAQLLDLRTYLQAAASNPADACGYPLPDHVDMHQGMSVEDTDRINHYRITSDFKWQIMDDIPVKPD